MSTDHVRFRWLDPTTENSEGDWNRVEAILKARGWMSLNHNTSRVLMAEDEFGALMGFLAFQLIPFVGPVWVHPSERGTGVADEMAQQMWEFLGEAQVRGWIAGAESAHGQRLCEMFDMERIEHPMYITVGMEKVQ